MASIWALLIYWLVTFVGCFVVIEIGQDQLYDGVTPHVGLKVTGGSLLLALMLTAFYYKGFPASFDSMFTNNILCTVFQAIVWFGVFTLIFQFHPVARSGPGNRHDAAAPGSGDHGRQQHSEPDTGRCLAAGRLRHQQARPPISGSRTRCATGHRRD